MCRIGGSLPCVAMHNPFRHLSMLLLLASGSLGAQVISTQAGDIPAAVSGLLGPNVTLVSAGISNAPEQVATFTDATGSIGMEGGMVLATGVHFVVIGPNNTDNASYGSFPGLFDMDLYTLSIPNSGTTDIARLDMEIIPWGDTLSIRYVFGSEEYDEYVCSVKDDRMAMFLDGPGIDGPFTGGAINMAVLPGSGLPVTVNTVNSGQPGEFGNFPLCNVNAAWLSDTVFYINTDLGQGTQLDAYTTVLTARAAVVPGEVYHLRITVADLDDDNFDSAVFLEAGSLMSNALTTAVPQGTIRDEPILWYNGPSSLLTVFGFKPGDEGVRFRVHDTTGRLVVEELGRAEGQRHTLPLQATPGLYVVQVTQGDQVVVGRVLIP